MNLKDKVAIVTGGSRGIGRAIAADLASEGCNLMLVAQNNEALLAAADEFKNFDVKVATMSIDLSNMCSAEKIIDKTIEELGRLDILVNNAGRSPKTNDPIDCDLEDWDNTLDVNLRSVYYLTSKAVPHIQKNKEGAVINISSISATMTYKNGGIYCTSKHAVKAYSGCLFDNIRESGIKVCSIFPGFVNTDMARSDSLNEGDMIQPSDVAETVKYVLKSSSTVCPTEIKLRPQRSPYK